MIEAVWRVVFHVLTLATVGTAALNMAHVRAGFLTNHAADLVVPAWMYVAARGLAAPRRPRTRLHRLVGRTPERAALALFVASALTEISQRFWPHGLFPGRFDPLDVLAYAGGLAACYVADRWWTPRADGRGA